MGVAGTTELAIRTLLREALRFSADASMKLLEEFWIPCSHERADIVRVACTLDCFEIKSERDTLARLPRQMLAYGRVFDRCTAVVAEQHADNVMTVLPEWWGVAVVTTSDSDLCVEQLRVAATNSAVDASTLVRLLWRDEVRGALDDVGIAHRPEAGRAALWDVLLDSVDVAQLRAIVRHALRGRDRSKGRFAKSRLSRVQGGDFVGDKAKVM